VFFRWPKAKVLPASRRKIKTDLMICLLPRMLVHSLPERIVPPPA
jgi:hypothetical protein